MLGEDATPSPFSISRSTRLARFFFGTPRASQAKRVRLISFVTLIHIWVAKCVVFDGPVKTKHVKLEFSTR